MEVIGEVDLLVILANHVGPVLAQICPHAFAYLREILPVTCFRCGW